MDGVPYETEPRAASRQPFHPSDERANATKDDQSVALCIKHINMTMTHRCPPWDIPIPLPEETRKIVLQWMDED
jgi:hypothetical protein